MEENRFKLARTKYNQHGKQSVKTVSAETKITRSLIDDLESNVLKKRSVGYLTVAKLAQYYGVTADYLLGLDDCPSIDPDIQSVCKYIGLSVEGVEVLREYLYENVVLTRLYSLEEFWDLISSLIRVDSSVHWLSMAKERQDMNWFSSPEKRVQLAYLNAMESLASLIDAMCNYHQVIKEAAETKYVHQRQAFRVLTEDEIKQMSEDDIDDYLFGQK